MLTAHDGLGIAKKLDAEITEGRKHTKVLVVIDGVVIGRYGLSRSSKDQAAGYIPKQIGWVTSRQARDLSHCPMSKEEYTEIIRKKGLLNNS